MSEQRWLRADTTGQPVGVEGRNILGYVVAQAGPFKSAGRGEFDERSLALIVRHMNRASKGVKSRLGHPTLSDDGVGRILGRSTNARQDVAKNAKGEKVPAVRADLAVSETAIARGYGQYVLDMAKEDPGLLSSSLVLQAEEEAQTFRGKPILDEQGNPKPPLWRPTAVHGSDIVDTGDAVDDLLSAKLDGLDLDSFDNAHRYASLVLDRVLSNMPRIEAERRLGDFVRRYLANRYGAMSDPRMIRAWAAGMRLTIPQ